MIWIVLLLGFLFGLAMQYTKLHRFDTISGMAVLEDLTVAKTIATAIGIGAILLTLEVSLGLASYHIKPLVIQTMIIGGLIFGVGMALMGYCPGTLPIAMGTGSVDAFIGIVGGFTAALLYPFFGKQVATFAGTTDLGKISLASATGEGTILLFVLVIIIGVLFVGISFYLNKIEKKRDIKWLISGAGIAIVACFAFASSLTNRPMGVSGFYTYFVDTIKGDTGYRFFSGEYSGGDWHMNFLLGAFISGLLVSVINKQFRLKLIPGNWSRFKGDSVIKRVIYAFIGGFLLITGSKIAGGCTSGHIISGGMAMAVSSYLFAVFVFAAFLLTGRIFYKK